MGHFPFEGFLPYWAYVGGVFDASGGALAGGGAVVVWYVVFEADVVHVNIAGEVVE